MFHITRIKERGQRYSITLLSAAGKIYGEIIVGRVRKVTEGLIDNVQGGFRAGRRFVDQVFNLR